MRLASSRRRLLERLRDEKGQSLALAALLVLFTFMAVMLTFAIGDRTRQKIKMQALADSAAYSAAVAEARTFNYFAWSNRARVAHDVAILSVFSHISYITNFEYIMYQTGAAFKKDGQTYLGYAPLCPATYGRLCCKVAQDNSKLRDAGDVYDGNNYPGAGYMKNLREAWDRMVGMAAQMHYGGIGQIKQTQQSIYDQLKGELQGQAMANRLAQTVDGQIQAPSGGADKQNIKHLEDAVLNMGPKKDKKANDDWNEIESATRLNDFVTNRKWIAVEPNWTLAYVMALGKAASNCFFMQPSVSNWGGNAKTVTEAPGSVGAVKSAIHSDQSDAKSGWAGSKGYAAEDHASVTVQVILCYDPCPFPASDTKSAEAGVFGDADGQSKHFWRDGAKSENDVGKHKFTPKDEEGIYMKHPRYIWGDNGEDKVWYHPHTVAVVTKAMSSGKKQPYEFELNMQIPLPMTYKTRNNAGDSQADMKMAAIGGGLVYYHKPKDSDAWKETPSFWNPYWRAKLHPLTKEDWDGATKSDHSPSNQAGDWAEMINY
ncbi:MAG TPA: hypothetical protein VGK67_18210 [Myxococcales bacterium]